jgi:hypothetical protein
MGCKKTRAEIPGLAPQALCRRPLRGLFPQLEEGLHEL